MDINTGRPPTFAPRGIVTCPHSLASQAGVDVLRAGGSAVDAAIATSAALSVIYPHMVGIGGDVDVPRLNRRIASPVLGHLIRSAFSAQLQLRQGAARTADKL